MYEIGMGLEYFLKTYFDVAYHLFLCPFKISRESSIFPLKRYSLGRSGWLHKVITGFFYFLSLVWIIGEIRLSHPDNMSSPGIYFKMAATFMDTMLKVIAFKQFWWDQHTIGDIINLASDWKSSFARKSSRPSFLNTSRFISSFIVGVSTTGMFYIWILGCSTTLPWKLTTWWEEMISRGRLNFFLENKFSHRWQIDVVIGGLASLGYLHRKHFGMFTDVLIIMAVLTVHRATTNFVGLLHDEDIQWGYIQGEYEKLKRLSRYVNSFIGNNMSCRLIVIILTWAFSLYETYIQNSGTHGIVSLFFFALYHIASFVVLLLCADICHQVCARKLYQL